MKKLILVLFIVFSLLQFDIFGATGHLEVVNSTNTMFFKYKFREAGFRGKTRGLYKKLGPGKSRKIKIERKVSAPDVRDFWIKAYDEKNQFLGEFKFSKNINIKNNKTTKIVLGWSLKRYAPSRKVYVSGKSKIDYVDYGKMGLTIFNDKLTSI